MRCAVGRRRVHARCQFNRTFFMLCRISNCCNRPETETFESNILRDVRVCLKNYMKIKQKRKKMAKIKKPSRDM